ncbi:MAG: multidrug ABC transporter permease [Rickettsiales bacterium]|nr:multidrug ABC transporter permease [Rickettsiales bacterium]|tara:strand:- start:705 stop:1475 length:771 start_codon:yes stop_codon:yes gene_type:complete
MFSYNYLCVLTLFKKEVFRFLKVGIQTVIGPAISSLLILAVFSLALGRSVNQINNVNLSEFIAPGLIMMTMLQNSFANAASSIGQSKFQGNIVDILMAPLSDYELAIGYILGSIARGIICGLITYLAILIFIPLGIHSFFALFFYSLMGCFMMGSVGTMVGIWADKWDQQQGITNFIVLPLTFLSGTFYSISRLPEFWQTFALFNPFFYNIDGFRYAFIGQSDTKLLTGAIILIFLNICLFFLCYLMFRKGYKLKY